MDKIKVNDEAWYTYQQLCDLLGITPKTLYTYVDIDCVSKKTVSGLSFYRLNYDIMSFLKWDQDLRLHPRFEDSKFLHTFSKDRNDNCKDAVEDFICCWSVLQKDYSHSIDVLSKSCYERMLLVFDELKDEEIGEVNGTIIFPAQKQSLSYHIDGNEVACNVFTHKGELLFHRTVNCDFLSAHFSINRLEWKQSFMQTAYIWNIFKTKFVGELKVMSHDGINYYDLCKNK